MVNIARVLGQLDAVDGSYFDGFPGYALPNSDNNRRAAKLATLLALVVGQDGIAGMAYGVGDYGYITKVGGAASAIASRAVPDTANAQLYNPFWASLNSELAALGGASYSDLPTYLTHQNSLTAWSGLMGPNAAYLYWLYKSGGLKTGATLLPARDVFAPITALGTATVGAGGAITFVAGSTIRTVNDTVGPNQGYAPAKGAIFTGTTLINGTLSVTVTYNGQTSAGVTFTGHTATVALDNLAVGATVTFTPPSGERVSAITAIAYLSGTATAGAFGVASQIERVTA